MFRHFISFKSIKRLKELLTQDLELFGLSCSVLLHILFLLSMNDFLNSWPKEDDFQQIHLNLCAISLTCLAMMSHLDLKLREYYTQSDTALSLDHQGIKLINEQANLGVRLCHDDELCPRIIEFGQIDAKQVEQLKKRLAHPKTHPASLSSSLHQYSEAQILKLEEYTELRVLSHLPHLNGRPQVGLFATQVIPKDALFVWRSDLALLMSSNHDLLPKPEQVNQRPLCYVDQAVALQSGGQKLRSNALTFVNFSWCHTDSVDAKESPYWLLPPHDLGSDNCHFASLNLPIQTETNLELGITSAIVIHKPIQAKQQLLAYSGSGYNAWVISFRRLISTSLNLMKPALIIWPWLRLMTFLQ